MVKGQHQKLETHQSTEILPEGEQTITQNNNHDQENAVNQHKEKYEQTEIFELDQLDEEYLKYCPPQFIVRKIQYNLTLLKFVSDLDQSIQAKQPSRCAELGLSSIKKDSDMNDREPINDIDRSINDRKLSSNRNSNKMLKNLITNDMFQVNLLKIRKIKFVLSENCKKLLLFLCKMNQGDNQWMLAFMEKLQTRIIRNQNMETSETSSQNQQNFWHITKENHEHFINSMHAYIFQKYNLVSLYNFLKNTVYTWICDHYVQAVKRQLNLLHELTEEIQKRQKSQQSQQSIITQGSQSSMAPSTGGPKLVGGGQRNDLKGKETDNDKFTEEAFLQVQQQTRIKVGHKLLMQAAMIEEEMSKPCCMKFVYQFSRIESSLFTTHPRLQPLIILHQQFIRDDSTGVQQKNQKSQINFKSYEIPIKKAISALLSNDGGFIFIGFKKQGQFYIPHSPFKLSYKSINKISKQIQQFAKEIMVKLQKSERKDIIFKNIKVRFIPIFKRRQQKQMKQGKKQFSNSGDFIWRISVLPDYDSKLALHPINSINPVINNAFFDCDMRNEAVVQLCDSASEKDMIYKKLRSIFQSYGNYKQEESFIQKHNRSKASSHYGDCVQIDLSSYASFANEKDCVNIVTRLQSLSTGENRKKNEKVVQKTQQEKNVEQNKKQPTTNGDSKQQFKQVNLIVLQNKQIKTHFQQYLSDNKVQFRIDKMDSGNLKKLAKQTYIIYHHKKFDEINSHLNDFKKKFNSKKNIILISAERSVFVEDGMDSKQLHGVKKLLIGENLQPEKVEYGEEFKDKGRKCYLRGETKLVGIYLYFVLSELGLKPKIKNVPLHMQTQMMLLDNAIKEKETREDSSRESGSRKRSGNGWQHNKPQRTYEEKMYFKHKNRYMDEHFGNEQIGYVNQNEPGNNGYGVDPQYHQYRQGWINYFIERYNEFYVKSKDPMLALEELRVGLTQNPAEWSGFWTYAVNQEQPFNQINFNIQESYHPAMYYSTRTTQPQVYQSYPYSQQFPNTGNNQQRY